jgi:hypothetical protein
MIVLLSDFVDTENKLSHSLILKLYKLSDCGQYFCYKTNNKSFFVIKIVLIQI